MEIQLRENITFGKYKGCNVIDLCTNQHKLTISSILNYLKWIEESTNHTLSLELCKFIDNVNDYYQFGCSFSSDQKSNKCDLYHSDNIEGSNPCAYIH